MGNEVPVKLRFWRRSVRWTVVVTLIATGGLLATAPTALGAPQPPYNGGYPISGAELYTQTPTLQARYNDFAGGSGWVDFQIYETIGGERGPFVAIGRGNLAADGAVSRWTVPAGLLADDRQYVWQARSFDGSIFSSWTGLDIPFWIRPSGNRSNAGSYQPSSSEDGQTVAFVSAASNLVLGDTNGYSDIYVRHEEHGLTTRVSWGTFDAQPNGSSWDPSISDDGRYVSFSSTASNLVADDTNGEADVFVADLETGDMLRASVDASGAEIQPAYCQAEGGGGVEGGGPPYEYEYLCGTPGHSPAISGDGRYVTFVSEVAGVADGGTDGSADVYVFDRVEGRTIERASVSSIGGGGGGRVPTISDDGSLIAFESEQPLVSGDSGLGLDVFVRNRSSQTTSRASVTSSGVQGNGPSTSAAIAGNGAYLVFASDASNLLAMDAGGGPDSDTNGRTDIYRRNLASGAILRASGPSWGWEPNGVSGAPVVADDGSRIAFESTSTNGEGTPCFPYCDSNSVRDIFEFDGEKVTRVSYDDRVGELESPSFQPVISGDGQAVGMATASAAAASTAAGTAAAGALNVFNHRFARGTACVLAAISVGAGASAIIESLQDEEIEVPGRYAMRVQLQEAGTSGIPLAKMPIARSRAIAVRELQAGPLATIYAQAQGNPNFPKRKGLAKLRSAVILASDALNAYPPGGIGPGIVRNFVQRTFTVPGRNEFRVDVDNLDGLNLRTFYP